nr:protein lethal(2)essential for life transcript variant X2 [Paroster macrosturtensis]
MSIFMLRDSEPRFDFDFSPEDVLLPLTISAALKNHHQHHHRGQVVAKKEKNPAFQVNVDVQQFRPEEVMVKVVDNCLLVEGKHEERQDIHGYVSREFRRRYILPEDIDINQVSSSLSSDGVLTLTAPKIEAMQSKERIIPIILSGPHRQQSVSEKKKKNTPEQQGDGK